MAVLKRSSAGRRRPYTRAYRKFRLRGSLSVDAANQLTAINTSPTATVHYNGTDGLGSITDDTNASGTSVRHRDYQAFGSTATDTAPTQDTGMGFTGAQQLDTGLVNLRARIYDPSSGRFLSRDPIGRTPTQPLLNAYSYTDNKPTTQTDPLGLRGIPTTTGDICSTNFLGSIGQSACEQVEDPFSDLHKAADKTGGYVDAFTLGIGSYGFNTITNGNFQVNKDSANYHTGGQVGNGILIATGIGAVLKTGVKVGVNQLEKRAAAKVVDEVAERETVTLYHGTTSDRAASIRANGIDLTQAARKADFGPGFYTTKDYTQALERAEYNPEGVLRYEIPRSSLEQLSGKTFAGGDEQVIFMRSLRNGEMHSYDVVEGPYVNNPRPFYAGKDPQWHGHQISFHTPEAVRVLNGGLQ